MVSDPEVKWHYETLPRPTRKALDALSQATWLHRPEWYLAGGTALALFGGHRQSVDLDFFTTAQDIGVEQILKELSAFGGDWQVVSQDYATLYGTLFKAKISFIAYPFFFPREPFAAYGALNVLNPRDIMVMKILAISQRGKKRDFFDLYWYVKNREPLIDIVRRLGPQFPQSNHNYHHLLSALAYFVDAESDSDPIITFNVSWKQVKDFFEEEVPRVAKEILQLQN